ncbi:MAG TPA: hypothetical protein VK832_05860 [Burkholderiaceae bacterium]|jgi:hypothetical protein|nr:hypothetical protein [Burkholderiaceae bacterium]
MKSRLTALLALMLACSMAFSSGAPWFRWKNKVNKTIMCAKISPGDVWVVMDGPYMESRCKKPGNPQ